MADRWNPPTLRMDPEKGGNIKVRCDCGRITNADMMTLLAEGYACDGCRERLILSGKMDRAKVVEAQGAPASVVERIRGKQDREPGRVTR